MDDPNFNLSNNFLVVATKNNRHSCLNVSIWDSVTRSFYFISAVLISSTRPNVKLCFADEIQNVWLIIW